MGSNQAPDVKSQSDKFKEAARAAECDVDESRWEARLKRVVKHKPVPEKPHK